MSIKVFGQKISASCKNESQKELIRALGFLLKDGTYTWEQFYKEIESYTLNEKGRALIAQAKN